MSDRVAWRLVMIAVVAGALLRFWAIGSPSLVGDEIASLATATGHDWHGPSGEPPVWNRSVYRTFTALEPGYVSQRLWSVLRAETQQPLYYVLLNAWLHLFGHSEVALRSLPALLSLGAIPLLYLLARSLASPEVGAYSALLMAAAPFQVAYSRFGRPYTLLLVVALASTLLTVRLARGDTRARTCLGYALVSVAGFYTHYLFVWIWGFQWLLILVHCHGNRALMLRWAASNGVVVLALLPWASLLLDQLEFSRNSGALGWAYWYGGRLSIPSEFLYVGRTIALLLSVGRLQGLCSSSGSSAPCLLDSVLTGISYAVPILIVVGCAWRYRVARRDQHHRLDASIDGWRVCLLWCLCVLGGPFAMDLLGNMRTVRSPYYFIAAGPPLYLGVALAMASFPKRRSRQWVLTAVLAFLLGASVLYLRGYSTIKYEQGWREVGHHLNLAAGPEDLILIAQPALNPLTLAYYLQVDLSIGTLLHGRIGREDANQLTRRVETLAARRQRVWILDDHGPEELARETLLGWFRKHYDERERRQFRNLDLFLFICRSDECGG